MKLAKPATTMSGLFFVRFGLMLFIPTTSFIIKRQDAKWDPGSLSEIYMTRRAVFPDASSRGPYLAIVTEPNACDTDENVETTLRALRSATASGQVDLISVRVQPSRNNDIAMFRQRLVRLVQQLVAQGSKDKYRVVVSSNHWDLLDESGADGVHVKESHRHLIAQIRQRVDRPLLVGTSAHSLSSAQEAWEQFEVDYIFVGTCYATLSHPEKEVLEGPELPGHVVRNLTARSPSRRPKVLAIGGIDASNCQETIQYGADGVATIRAVLQANDPSRAVKEIKDLMTSCDPWSG